MLSLIDGWSPNYRVILHHFSLYYKLVLSCRSIQPVDESPMIPGIHVIIIIFSKVGNKSLPFFVFTRRVILYCLYC
jgi:hypothetical protein